jgi:hypothetical protein
MTKSPPDTAADAAREVLSKIEDVTFSIRDDLQRAILNLDDLYNHSETLCREIVDTVQVPSDPFAMAAVEAIDNLLALLTEARNHFESDCSISALGALVPFDNHADDLKAAIHLIAIAQRRRQK